ncbi:MAG: hypothetical protein N2544_12500 [Burkholderiales bacterium]|nr:hypothetical protein [Burkholderiales bacterium]
MRYPLSAGVPGFVLAVLALAGCATTSLVASWTDESWQGGKREKLLVVGVARDATLRRVYEDEFVRRAAAAGVQAVQSYRFIPEDGPVPEERLRQAVAESGADGVLTSALLAVTQQTTVSPGFAAPPVGFGYYGFYRWGWGSAVVAPTVQTYFVFFIDTRLHDAKSNALIWAGTTRTASFDSAAAEIRGFVDVVLGALRAKGVV